MTIHLLKTVFAVITRQLYAEFWLHPNGFVVDRLHASTPTFSRVLITVLTQ